MGVTELDLVTSNVMAGQVIGMVMVNMSVLRPAGEALTHS